MDVVVKELDRATGDLEASNQTLKGGDQKWAAIQAYYSMFHAARALLCRMGYRENSPSGLLAALQQLYEREIIREMIQGFKEAMMLSEEANDGLIVTEELARNILEKSTNFLEETARILAAPREWFERPAPRRPPKAKKR